LTTTTNTRRHELDKLRDKAWGAAGKLYEALDEDGHDEDCVLRCLVPFCTQMHSCDACREDGEV